MIHIGCMMSILGVFRMIGVMNIVCIRSIMSIICAGWRTRLARVSLARENKRFVSEREGKQTFAGNQALKQWFRGGREPN